jgi:hypothetical protein
MIFGNTYGTSAITHERNVGALLIKVTKGIGDPKKLRTTTSSSYILDLSSRLSYTSDCLQEDQETNEELKN